jgi:glycosyltransferase involved in cell wall biosynthesis
LPIHYEKLATALSKRGHQVTVLYADRFGSNADPFVSNNFEFIPLQFPFPRILHFPVLAKTMRLLGVTEHVRFLHDSDYISSTLKNLQKNQAFDIIESPNNGSCFHRYKFQINRTCIRIATTDREHSSINSVPTSPYLKSLFSAEGKTFRKCPNLVTHTVAHRNNICSEYNLSKEKFSIIPLSVRIPKEEELRSIDENRPQSILFVGRFEERKGIDLLLEIIPIISEKYPNVIFRLIGLDKGKKYQKSFLQTYPTLNNRVLFLGEKREAELEEEYRNCSIFIAPSRYESFGLIYAEAMSFGKPVIGTNVGGIPEVIENNKSGFLCENKCVKDFVRALSTLLENKELRKGMGAYARKLVAKSFDFDNLVTNTERYFQNILEKKKN